MVLRSNGLMEWVFFGFGSFIGMKCVADVVLFVCHTFGFGCSNEFFKCFGKFSNGMGFLLVYQLDRSRTLMVLRFVHALESNNLLSMGTNDQIDSCLLRIDKMKPPTARIHQTKYYVGGKSLSQ